MDDKLWEDRKKVLTASDMTVLLGQSPWSSEEQIWLEKKGLLERGPTNLSCASGIILEPLIRDLWNESTGVRHTDYENFDWFDLAPEQKFYRSPEEYLGATPDGILSIGDQRWGQEIKSTSEVWEVLPDRVITQCVVGMIVTGIPRWKVISYHLAKGEATQIVVDRALANRISLDSGKMKTWDLHYADHHDLVDDIKRVARTWWETYIVGDLRPEPPAPKPKKPTKKQLEKMAQEAANAEV